jgi:hypothetical protein
VPLRRFLTQHAVSTAFELGWSTLPNGDLLAHAAGRFDLLVSTDRSLRHQQDLRGRQLAILVLPTTSWPRIQRRIPDVRQAVASIKPGEYRELEWAD